MTVIAEGAGTLRALTPLERLCSEEVAMEGRTHAARAEFYRRRVSHPLLAPAVQASLAAYHASMAVLEKVS